MGYKFLLFGTDVGTNYGCDAIVLGTSRILRENFPGCEVWFPQNSWRANNYHKIFGIDSGIKIPNNSVLSRTLLLGKRILEKVKIIKKEELKIPTSIVKKSDCIISIGGDLYTFADKETNWPFPYTIMEAGNKIMKLGKPYVIWCASIGPFDRAGNRLEELVEHLRSCTAIIVREKESFQYLREKLNLTQNVFLAADPAFVMESDPIEVGIFNKWENEKVLAINFSRAPMEHIYGHLPVEKFQSDLVLFVKRILENLPIKILFVPHVMTDFKFLPPIFEKIRETYPDRVKILPADIGAKKTKWAVSQANALLTMRFHCSLAGFSTNTPTVILVSTSKGAKICKEMYGDLEYGVSIEDMDGWEVIKKIKNLLENEKLLREKLSPISKEMENRALNAGKILSKIIS